MNKHVVYIRIRDGKPFFGERPRLVMQRRLPARTPLLVHEARNPLCHINLACDLLCLSGLNTEQRKCVDIIVRNSNRINDFINTLLGDEGNVSVSDVK